ncbi:uncharacterized protein BO80DRAFT_453889 [Aspergillus ibericus CBS 121593]|uniref:Uncharacterized protein n=1 Tax=Aspergillus ibericus CBS 121593 TaxID=1448316 RepID=A0A395H4D2_9EURO|nr:hypothetical protein BO80DRAFT_453889 [Aspergillus ibericus CBS 121593]RAL02687.1 hypothetical protein BO80DRAFT_453889 [Aspergillus ibericus CBS 121593]
MPNTSQPVPAGSTLERLPVEIIQEIFLHCLEVNLPRASITIARALSNPVLYTWVIRCVFSSTNKSSRHGIFTPDFLPAPLDVFSISPKERRDLQNIILGCRWCTLPLMRKCQREYVEHAVHRKCGGLVFSPSDREILANLGNRFENIDIHRDEPHGYRGKGELILKGKVRKTNADCKVALWFNFGALQIRASSDIYTETDIFRLPCFTVDLPVRVPDKLLCPPWTEAKLEFLQLLSMDAYMDDEADHPRAKRVLRQVIRDRDLETFQRLLNMSIRVPWYNFPIRWPVLPNHFYVALKYAEERDDPFVHLLVTQRWDDIPPDDFRLKMELMSKGGKGR